MVHTLILTDSRNFNPTKYAPYTVALKISLGFLQQRTTIKFTMFVFRVLYLLLLSLLSIVDVTVIFRNLLWSLKTFLKISVYTRKYRAIIQVYTRFVCNSRCIYTLHDILIHDAISARTMYACTACLNAIEILINAIKKNVKIRQFVVSSH